MEESNILIENSIFSNYRELCEKLNWVPLGGKVKKLRLNKLSSIYEVKIEGRKITIGPKKKEEYFNEEHNDKKEDYEEALDILNSHYNNRNEKYLANNFLLYLYYIKNAKDNTYATFTIRQMREFGFLRSGIRPDYANSNNEFYAEGPKFSIDKDFRLHIDNELEKVADKKSCMSIFREIFGALRERYVHIMDSTCAKLVSEESIDSFGTWITKAQWDYFKKHYNQSINFLYRSMEMIGIKKMKDEDVTEEVTLSRKEVGEYFKIRNRVIEKEKANKMNYTDISKYQSRIFGFISKACEKELGYGITYRKLYFVPLKDTEVFNITLEDANKARQDNNTKMKKTIKEQFKRKMFIHSALYNIYEECIDYIMDITK